MDEEKRILLILDRNETQVLSIKLKAKGREKTFLSKVQWHLKYVNEFRFSLRPFFRVDVESYVSVTCKDAKHIFL
jgi:hypothetical protein